MEPFHRYAHKDNTKNDYYSSITNENVFLLRAVVVNMHIHKCNVVTIAVHATIVFTSKGDISNRFKISKMCVQFIFET